MTLSLTYAKTVDVQTSYDIDHPALDGYLDRLNEVPNDEQQDALRLRFKSSEVNTDPEIVIARLGEVIASAAIHRQNYERVVTGGAGLGLTDGERELYKQLAGNPERIAEYVCWFGKMALRHFALTPKDGLSDKIGLELGGKMQGGDWESTSDLDNMIRRLPAQSKEFPQLSGELLEGSERLHPSYRFMALGVQDKHNYDKFGFGIGRRRRGVANLNVVPEASSGKGLSVKIFKESLVLVVMRELNREQRIEIREDVSAHPIANTLFNFSKKNSGEPDEGPKPQNDTKAALTVGKAFKAAIKEKAGTTRGIVPASAHYVMYTERP